jgi:hypothetical protein
MAAIKITCYVEINDITRLNFEIVDDADPTTFGEKAAAWGAAIASYCGAVLTAPGGYMSETPAFQPYPTPTE